MHQPQNTYLALGDSYTIGEAVPLVASFPYQTVGIIREKGFSIADPEILAFTGWTTDELIDALKRKQFTKQYDFVTLLIGVNNQYRGRSLEGYKSEFGNLLEQAIELAGNKKDKVVVLSIPDYSLTPFAKDKNPGKISRELASFNAAAEKICVENGVYFLDISHTFREALDNAELVAPDGLHPSGKAYKQWAEQLSVVMLQHIK